MHKELFDPERGWIPGEQLLKELEDKAKKGKLTPKEAGTLEDLKKLQPDHGDLAKKGVGDSDNSFKVPDDYRPGNYL